MVIGASVPERVEGVRLGTVVRTVDPATLHALNASALDWLMLDGEAATVGHDEIATMLRVLDGPALKYVRVREIAAAHVHHAVAHGAHGVVFPNVHTAQLASTCVDLVRRSMQRSVQVVVQAESHEAVQHIDEIVRVPGIEWVLIGPNDLSSSLGVPGDFSSAVFQGAVTAIEAGCRAAQLPVGMFGMTRAAVAPCIERGHQWALIGIDQPA